MNKLLIVLLITLSQDIFAQIPPAPLPTIIEEKKDVNTSPFEAPRKWEEIEEDTPKKKEIKKTKNYDYFYEFVNLSGTVNYKKSKINRANGEVEFNMVDFILKKTDANDIKFIDYNDDYIYFNSWEKHTIKNYIIYKQRNKYGVILNDFIISAEFDSVGKPLLVKGKEPMILVAKEKKKKLKWGIINSKGTILIPIEFDVIEIPVPTDLIKQKHSENIPPLKSRIINNFDGLYQNQKIIVKKNNKYGLYNAVGKQILEVKYDEINKSEYLDFYSLKEKNKYGFLVVKENKIRTWGTSIKNTQENKDYLLLPKLDFPILKEKGTFYNFHIKNKNVVKTPLKESEVWNMLDK